MIAGHCDGHHGGGRDLSLPHHNPFFRRPDSENRAVRRIDDRGEIPDAEHAKIGNCETAAFIFLRLEFFLFCAFGEVLHLIGDFDQSAPFRPEHNGCDQTGIQIHRNADIGMTVLQNGRVGPARIDLGMPDQRMGGSFDDKVIDRQLVCAFGFGRAIVQSRPCLHQRVDIAVDGEIEMRDQRLGGSKPAGDGFPHGIIWRGFVFAFGIEQPRIRKRCKVSSPACGGGVRPRLRRDGGGL